MKTETTITIPSTAPKADVSNGRAKYGNETSSAPDENAGQIRIGTILVPVDFSAACIKALKYAAAFAEQFGAKLILLHVIEPVATPDFIASSPLIMEAGKLVRISQKKLEGLAKKHAIKPALIERVVVRRGTPFNEISNAARELGADVIVISTHGHTGLRHLLLGSTTERVVRHADCPVFVVRDGEREIIEPV
jgi:nucleotide-binding universal stress UspA family protein